MAGLWKTDISSSRLPLSAALLAAVTSAGTSGLVVRDVAAQLGRPRRLERPFVRLHTAGATSVSTSVAKPASVAFPGGRIFVDGKLMGTDTTATLVLEPGAHDARIENRFLGDHDMTVNIAEGQTGVIVIDG